jgi:aspartate aminotransferase
VTITTSEFTVSPNVAAMRESATIAVSTRARELRAEGREIIDLGAGELDFPTPELIRKAAAAAIEEGATRYTATPGIIELREAIARRANEIYSGSDRVSAANVVVTTGSKQALFNACFVLFGEGDEVLIPTPAWTSYYEMVSLAKATGVPVQGSEDNGLKISARLLANAATDRTRGVMINSPCNPTGSVYDLEELKEILQLASDRGWWVIADEIYRRIVYEGTAPSSLEAASSLSRLIVVDGVAKAYAMTGWRIGWAVAPVPVAKAMSALQSHTTSNAAAPSQHAALAALTLGAPLQPAVEEMLHKLKERRAMCLEMLASAPGVQFVHPRGAFYLYISAASFAEGADSGSALASHLLDEHGVAVVPGAAFMRPEWIRVSFAAPGDTVREGMRRIIAVLESRRP